jgi:very-short-patch-repair endonuclease
MSATKTHPNPPLSGREHRQKDSSPDKKVHHPKASSPDKKVHHPKASSPDKEVHHPKGSSPDKGRLGGVSSPQRTSLFIPYNPKLKEYARQNRKNPTAAEIKMWQMLNRKQFINLKFTRQKPLGQFIADFYCPQLLLVIEIDGDTHTPEGSYDIKRSNMLKEKYEIEVLRYTNNEILHNLEGVYTHLLTYVEQKKNHLFPE